MEYSEGNYGRDVYGEDRTPIVRKRILEYFPSIFKREDEDGNVSTLANFVNMHNVEVDRFDASLDYVKQSRQIDNATGRDLDRIGSKFGQLGNRAGRSDDEYKTYLKGIMQSFRGRGTKPGIKYAVSSAINTDRENITINEDFENNQYDLRIEDTDVGFLSSVVNTVAELADPAGVELASPPVITLEGADIRVTATESKVIESTSGLGSDEKVLDGSWELK